MANSVTFPEDLGGNGQTYTDDADPDTGLDGLGYTVRFIPCLQQAVAMGLSAQSNAAATADYLQQCQSLREAVGADRQAVGEDRTHIDQQKGLVDNAAQQVSTDKQAVADDRTHIDQQKGLVDNAAQQVTDDKQTVASDRQHVDEQKGLVDTAAQQVTDDKQTVAADRQTATEAAGAATDAAGVSIQAKDSAEALYGDLQAVEDAKTASQQAVQDAGQQRDLAVTAREGAEQALSDTETVRDEAQQTVSQAVGDHEAKTDPHDQYYNESRLTIWSRDKERQALEAATGGACTIERTEDGQACHMFVVPRLRWQDLLPGEELGTGTHEAFIENGVEKSELLVGMYMASQVSSELVSQPRREGRHTIDWDQSNSEAQAAGFGMMSTWDWSAVAFWCMANGFQPRGNTDYGRSHSYTHERGIYDSVGSGDEYTLLGTGPNTWSHNNAANGIADLVGNRWEWQWGFKMVDGRIMLAPDNDRSVSDSNWSDTGWGMPGNQTWASVDNSGAPESVKRALIVPNGVADPDGNLYTNLDGERLPRRGGSRNYAGHAGLAALSLIHTRAFAVAAVGLRLSRLV